MRIKAVLFILVLFAVQCAGNDGAPGAQGPAGQGGTSRAVECTEGDHDFDFDGVRDVSIECWPNGNRKKRINYQHKDGAKKINDFIYWESNGKIKAEIYYYPDGTTKRRETTLYESNGNLKAETIYRSDSTISSLPTCYKPDGIMEETCHPVRHGLPTEYMALTFYDAAGTKLETYIQYSSTAKTTKWSEAAYWESNGNRKAYISYQSDGTTKSSESTYYEGNGNEKTYISYQSDGISKERELTYWENENAKTQIQYQSDGTKVSGYPKCYDDEDDGFITETCTQEKHGCTSASETCITQ